MKEASRELAGMGLLLAVLTAVVFLAYNKVIDGQAAISILTSIVTLGGGAIAVHSGIKAANGGKK